MPPRERGREIASEGGRKRAREGGHKASIKS